MYLGQFAEGGFIAPLDDYLADPDMYPAEYDLSDFNPTALDTGKYNGKQYGLPYQLSTLFLYYRTDYIQDPPDTWAEFLTEAKKWTKEYNPDSPFEYGAAVQMKRGEPLPKYFYHWFWSFGGEFFDADMMPQFNSSQGVEALTYFTDLLNEHRVIPPDAPIMGYSETMTVLQSETVPMVIQWDASYVTYTDSELSPAIWDKIEIAPVPGLELPDETVRRAAFVHAWQLVLNNYASNKDAAFRALAWMTGPEGLAQFDLAGGCSGCLRDSLLEVDEILEAQPHLPRMNDWVAAYGNWERPIPEWAQIHSLENTYLSLAVAEKLTPQETMDALNEEIYILLNEKGYYG
jgi:ABC-type glycerol-3-phosphate transport system substrate-binding protein